MYDENEVYDLQRGRELSQRISREKAQEFLRGKFAADAEFRPIHLTFKSLTALLVEYEEHETQTPLGGIL
jgi:hypothetical protein